MASVQSVHMNYDPLTTSSTATKRKIDDVGLNASPDMAGSGNDDTSGLGDEHDAGESRGEISESKRRAQNRAAQRAFRERKERHLKELETRLAQLESESRSWKSTNMALRSQLSLLEEELQQYRRPQGDSKQAQSQPHHHLVDSATNGLPAHMLPPPQQPYAPSLHSNASGDPQRGGHDTRSNSSHNGSSPESMSLPGLSFDSPGSASSSTPNRADEFCDKLSLACGTRDRPVPVGAPQIAAESPRWQEDALLGNGSSEWAGKNNWLAMNSFGGRGVPGGGALYGSETPLPENTPNSLGSNLGGSVPFGGGQPPQTPNKTSGPDDPLNLDFGILSTGFGGFGLPSQGDGANQNDPSFNLGLFPPGNVSGLLNTDYGMFDPLEDMLEWNPAKDNQQRPDQTPQQQQQQEQQQQQQQQQQHQQQPRQQHQQAVSPNSQIEPQNHSSLQPAPPQSRGGIPRGAPSSQKPGDSSGIESTIFKVEDPGSIGSMGGLGYFGGADSASGPLAGLEEQVPAASQRFIPCSDVWDRICNHPRFGEIDINSMCQELRSRARCSNTGVVLDEEDVNKVLGTIK